VQLKSECAECGLQWQPSAGSLQPSAPLLSSARQAGGERGRERGEEDRGGGARMGGGSGGSGPGQWQLLQKEAELRLAVALSECLGFRRAEGAAVARQLL